jgi:hypothetical protein
LLFCESSTSPVDFSITRYEYGRIVISRRNTEDSSVPDAAQLAGE